MNVHWQRLLIVLCAAFGLAGALGPLGATAQERVAPPWEQLTPPGPVYRLFMPAGGVVYALTGNGLYRSNDTGTSWSLIQVPHLQLANDRSVWSASQQWQSYERGRVAINPSDSQTIYAPTESGIGKTVDGGDSWTTVLPVGDVRSSLSVLRIAVSLSAPNVVYVALGNRPSRSDYEILRSTDAGITWSVVRRIYESASFFFNVFQPNPADADTLLVSYGQSTRSGYEFLSSVRTDGSNASSPEFRAGNSTTAPSRITTITSNPVTGRLYLSNSWTFPLSGAFDGQINETGRAVFVSDDGIAWTETYRMVRRPADGSVRQSSIVALAPIPDHSGGMYVAVREEDAGEDQVASVLDGTTVDVENIFGTGMGRILDLAVSPGSQYLYAATENGLWRLPDPTSQGR